MYQRVRKSGNLIVHKTRAMKKVFSKNKLKILIFKEKYP